MDETSTTEQTPAGDLPDTEPDYKDLYLRALADADNTRKRMMKQQTQTAEYATRDLVKRLLPVIDHFNLAIDHGEAGDGVQLAFKELMEALASEGLAEIEVAEGAEFDPTIHHALTTMPDPGAEHDTVRQVHRKGYRFRDHVLRAPEVVVAQAPQEN
jgi:molecular chaperone GrpE